VKIFDKLNQKYLEMQNATQEKAIFIDVFGEIVDIGRNKKLSREEKFKRLQKSLDKFNDADFETYIVNIVNVIQNKKEQCEVFKTTQEQVNSMYEIVPRLKTQEKAVYEIVNERRKGFELPYDEAING
jgi:hypothetical protein